MGVTTSRTFFPSPSTGECHDCIFCEMSPKLSNELNLLKNSAFILFFSKFNQCKLALIDIKVISNLYANNINTGRMVSFFSGYRS